MSRDDSVVHGLLDCQGPGGSRSYVEQVYPAGTYDEINMLARDFYFYERHLPLQNVLYLMEQRLSESVSILRATDSLFDAGQLVTGLLTVIRDYTQRIAQLQQEIIQQTTTTTTTQQQQQQQQQQPALNGWPGGGGAGGGGAQQQQKSTFARVHLLFCLHERQTAAEILVLMAYQTQFDVGEVGTLLDVIRDLSNTTTTFSPYTDVPSPYETMSSSSEQETYRSMFSSSSSVPQRQQYPWDQQRKTKNPLHWQTELVQHVYQTGQPQLVQCTSLLLVAALAAMDTRQVLWDRTLHGPNAFGRGNQFVQPPPPRSSSSSSSPSSREEAMRTQLHALQTRLRPEAHTDWSRPEMWGLLACAYALLLRGTPSSSSSLLLSPTKGGASSSPWSKEVRDAARTGMILPAELNSFTFCRLTLIPALVAVPNASSSRRTTVCNVSEFGLSVVAEMYAAYLSVLSEGTANLPISRYRWQTREEEDLKLRRDQTNQQRQFEQFMGTNNTAHNHSPLSSSGLSPSNQKAAMIPAAIDLMERPECLDDLIALATTLCSLGSEYARVFWGTDTETKALVPSTALQACVLQASKDSSLTAYVFSWMAALSTDEESATAIHRVMSNTTVETFTSWNYLLYNLKWLTEHLNNGNKTNMAKPTANPTKNSTSYYYNLEGNAISDTSSDSQSRAASRNSAASSASSSSKSPKPQELSEHTKLQVASYLAMIMNVSRYSGEARYTILSIDVPDTDGTIGISDERCLCILFNLVIGPLVPQLRGATLSTIASLLQSTETIEDPKIKSFLDEQANTGWKFLETSSLLPISLLDRYHVNSINGVEAPSQVTVNFPPSSMILATSTVAVDASTIPNHTNYGLLFEMDHVESKKGIYPSTEGFLDLLKSLVSSVGCPSDLGQSSRGRTGCTPYIEYVVHFALSKALGVNSQPQLPFRVASDRSRLVSRALAVVEAVIIRYNMPTGTLSRNIDGGASPFPVLGLQAVFDQVHVTSNETGANEVVNDFKSMTTSMSISASDILDKTERLRSTASSFNNQSRVVPGSTATGIPVPKSPGFTILVEMLSSSCGILLQELAIVLTECGGPSGVLPSFGEQSDRMNMAYAVFCSTPPTFNSAKEGSKQNGHRKPLQNLLKPFSPKFLSTNIDDNYVDNPILWRETSIALALKILCAAAVREDAFIEALSTAKEKPLKIIPVLQFQGLKSGGGRGNHSNIAIDMTAKDVQVSRLTDLLFSIQNSRFLRSTIVEYVGYNEMHEMQTTEISASALSMVYRMQQTIPAHSSLCTLIGDESDKSATRLSQSFASRLIISSKKVGDTGNSQVMIMILNWILSDLRKGSISNDSIAQVLLGLPSDTNAGNWTPGQSYYSGSIKDCFDAILDVLEHDNTMSVVSSLCFEIFFRLHDLIQSGDSRSLKISIYTAKRLRHVDFWKVNIRKILLADLDSMDSEQLINMIHTRAWLLKGVSSELRFLVGFSGDEMSASGFGRLLEPHPEECNLLLSSLFGFDSLSIHSLIQNTPLEIVSIDPNLGYPSKEAVRASVYDLPGAKDVVEGYQILDSNKAISSMNKEGMLSNPETTTNILRWIKEWNFIARRNCAVSHLSSAMDILIKASLYSAKSISLYRNNSLQPSISGHSLSDDKGLRDLLWCFLQRLDVSPHTNYLQGMDGLLLPVATKNLSNVILSLSEFMTSSFNGDMISLGDSSSSTSSSCIHIGALIARITEFSSVGQDTAEEAPFRYERTATLGSALALILRSSASLEPEFTLQYKDDFIRAARGLARISHFKVDGNINDSRGIVSMIGRGCIASIIVAVSQNECDDPCSCIPPIFLEQLMSRVAELDEDVCNFLQVLALKPSGAKLLINAGIVQALLTAANQYALQEIEVAKKLGSSSFSKSTIRTPGFLLSHTKLMCSLLTTAELPEQSANHFSVNCIKIIAIYKPTIKRLSYNFPLQSDFLRSFLKVINLLLSFANPIEKKLQSSIVRNKSGLSSEEIISRLGFLDNGIVMLLEHLSISPLPRDLLPGRVPKELKCAQESSGSSIVSVEKDCSSTWWDVLRNILITRHSEIKTDKFLAPVGGMVFPPTGARADKWSEDTFEYSIVASDVLFLGLNALKRINQPQLIDVSNLALGLFQTVFAAKSVCDRAEHVRLTTTTTVHLMETDENLGSADLEIEYLDLLGLSLCKCVEQMLILCLQLCGAKENGQELIPKQILIAIESSGIDQSSFSIISEARQEFISILCEEIKKVCKGI